MIMLTSNLIASIILLPSFADATAHDNPFCADIDGSPSKFFSKIKVSLDLRPLCDWAGCSQPLRDLMIDSISSDKELWDPFMQKVWDFLPVEEQCVNDWIEYQDTVPSANGSSDLSPIKRRISRAIDLMTREIPQTENALNQLESALKGAKWDSNRYQQMTKDYTVKEEQKSKRWKRAWNCTRDTAEYIWKGFWGGLLIVVIGCLFIAGVVAWNGIVILGMSMCLQWFKVLNDVIN